MPFNEDEGFYFLLCDLLVVTRGGHVGYFFVVGLAECKAYSQSKVVFLFFM